MARYVVVESQVCKSGLTKPDTTQAPTKGRVLDDYGFDVKGHGPS
jgi:hypothetical protein